MEFVGPVSEMAEIFAEVLEIPRTDIGPADRFYEDLGGDSLQKLEVIVAVEKRFNVRFSPEQGERLESVKDFAAEIVSIQ